MFKVILASITQVTGSTEIYNYTLFTRTLYHYQVGEKNMSGQFLQGGSLQWNHNLYLLSAQSTVGEVTLSFTATLLLLYSFANNYGEKRDNFQ